LHWTILIEKEFEEKIDEIFFHIVIKRQIAEEPKDEKRCLDVWTR